jgi:hypothetical protein
MVESGVSWESWLAVGLAVAAFAGLAAAWAWRRQRQLAAELLQRLEASENSRLDLQAHVQEVDNQLASVTQALSRGAAVPAVPLSSATGATDAAERALLAHLGDPDAATDSGWIDTEPLPPATAADEPDFPAFAETQPIDLNDLNDLAER